MFERYSESARRALFFARYELTELGGAAIEPEHLVLGVLRASPRAIGRFTRSATSEDLLRRQLADTVAAPDKLATSVEIPFSRATKEILEHAVIEADDLNNRWIAPAHLILAVMVKTTGEATRALHDAGVEVNAIRDYLRNRPEDAGDLPGTVSPPRVVRQWKGIVKPGLADKYIRHLREETFPSLRAIPGFVYANILCREVEDGTEFQVETGWRSLDAIKAFAGDDIAVAVVPPEAQKLMVRYDDRAVHYDIVLLPSTFYLLPSTFYLIVSV
jgi:hypothetical protein